jgi:N-acetylglucosamine kinase-like BadF-type ATPase
MAYYLGIDGGGTKTRCLLADETAVLARATTGGCSIIRLGEQAAREALHSGIRQVCTTAKIAPAQLHAVCIGATGAARPEIAGKIRAIVAELLTSATPPPIEVVGDNLIALDAAFGAGPGSIAVAGTGSIVYGRSADGRTARAGGWGFAISDEGSGYWIGRRAVSAILKAKDEGVDSALTDAILKCWKLSSTDDLIQFANTTPPPDFPRLFPVVLHVAESGDSTALNLLSAAGTELGELTAIVVRRLFPPASAPTAVRPPVAMTGSVFRQSAVVRQIFYNHLHHEFPGIEIRQELVDPVVGALKRARQIR